MEPTQHPIAVQCVRNDGVCVSSSMQKVIIQQSHVYAVAAANTVSLIQVLKSKSRHLK